MIPWFKRHFIPHEGNNHRPHILHHHNVHRIIGFVIFLEIVLFLLPTLSFVTNADTQTILPSVLSLLTNKERTAQQLPALTESKLLNTAAQQKAEDMATLGYFAHVSPEGKTPWYWIDRVGYQYEYAGENLAVNFTDSKDVTTAWMNSPTHRANIIKANYTQIGTGVSTGQYEGKEAVFVAQVYGKPLSVVPIVVHRPVAIAPAQSIFTVEEKGTTEAVLGVESENIAPIPVEVEAVVSETIPDIATMHQATLLERMLASPRATTNAILFAIMAFVVVALALNIGIKISHHHPDLITNGIMAIAVTGIIVVSNNYISKSTLLLTQSADYTNEHVILQGME